jgi:hypothetical protein
MPPEFTLEPRALFDRTPPLGHNAGLCDAEVLVVFWTLNYSPLEL